MHPALPGYRHPGITAAPAGEAPTIASAHISATEGGSVITEADIGDTLWAVENTVTGSPSPTLTYQWYVNASPAGGTDDEESFDTTGLDDEDEVTVEITVTNSEGSDDALSAAVDMHEVQVRPTLVASLEHWNSTASTISNWQLSLASTGAQAGDEVIGFQNRSGDGVYDDPPSGGSVVAYIPRASGAAGVDMNNRVWRYTLTGTDISNNYITVPRLSAFMGMAAAIVRNLGSIETAINGGAGTGFTRSANASANTNALPSVAAPTRDALAIAVNWRNGGNRTTSIDGGYTMRAEGDNDAGGSSSAGYNPAFATQDVDRGETAPSATFTVSGTADMTLNSGLVFAVAA